jgi:tRNA modification GTPase
LYNINDTIIAVSSGTTPSAKKIVRISSDKTFDILESLTDDERLTKERKITAVLLKIAENFTVEAKLYLFPSGHSYTGDDLAEIHFFACDETVEHLFSKLISLGCRNAEAGEFTYRAYINGRMDLSQAEAVAQLIQSSNQYQLSAAQKLFGGSIEKMVKQIREKILEVLSLIEAGLDFSAEDIEIISTKKAVEKAEKIRDSLNELLAGSITFEQIIDAPSVIVAGSTNAGKSSLVNALVGEKRSIVSDKAGTTRDVLEHWLKLENCDCVLSDTAGLVIEPADILQNLANTAVLNAINDAAIIIFGVDVSKQDYSADIQILKQFQKKTIICIATKCDLLKNNKIQQLKTIFGYDFLETSSKNLTGIDKLKEVIQENIIRQTPGTMEAAEKTALTERHRQAVIETIKNTENACVELEKGNEEIAAMFLRSALQNLSSFETEHIDETILETIFSRFCIGK